MKKDEPWGFLANDSVLVMAKPSDERLGVVPVNV